MSEQPNILVVMSDQHRHDALGGIDGSAYHTPHLDRLAREGVRFTDAYCNNPICVPSRSSFITGRTTNQIEVWSLSDALRSDEVTWPSVLGAAGYETVVSGRTHAWWFDKVHGFHRRLCGEHHTRVSRGTWELYEPGPARDRQCQRFREEFLHELRSPEATGRGPHMGYVEDAAATDHAVTYLREWSQASDERRPFALYVGYYCPHSPLRFPDPHYQRFADLDVEPGVLDETLPEIVQAFVHAGGFDEPIERDVAIRAIRAYYAMVHFVDEQVGRLIAALEAIGELDNTVILYTSDHGEMLGERGLWFKNQLLDPAARVPLLWRWPQRFAGGRLVQRPVSLVDVLPTLAEIGGAEAEIGPWMELAGASLAPALWREGAGDLPDRPVFIEYADFGIGEPAAALRWGQFKLLCARNFPSALYDLKSDPGETVNLYAHPEHRATRDQLESALSRFWDGEDTYRRVVRNQKRIDLIRRSRQTAIAHGVPLSFGVTD